MGRVAWSCLFVFVFAVAVAPLAAPDEGQVARQAVLPVMVPPPPPLPLPAPPRGAIVAPAARDPARPGHPAPLRPPSIPPVQSSASLAGVTLPQMLMPEVPMPETRRLTSTISTPVSFAIHETPSRLTRPEVVPPRLRPVSLVPMYASFATLQALDYHSTMRALSSGAGVEANPLVRPIADHPAGMIALKAGATVAMVWASERMWKRHPVQAIVFMAAANTGMAIVVAHNYSVK